MRHQFLRTLTLLTLTWVGCGQAGRTEEPTQILAFREPLGHLLRRLPAGSGPGLAAERALTNQRVSLILEASGPDHATLRRGLSELLSADEAARCTWVREKGRWTLVQNQARRTLPDKLRAGAIGLVEQLFEEYLIADHGEAAALPPDMRGTIANDFAQLMVKLGVDRRKAMFSGTPLVVKLTSLPEADRGIARRLLTKTTPHLAELGEEGLDRCSLVYTVSRAPTDPLRVSVVAAHVSPRRRTGVRFDCWSCPGGSRNPDEGPRGLSVPPPNPADLSRRVNVRLGAEKNTGSNAWLRSYEQVLGDVARQTGLQFVSDGYLRIPAVIRPGLEVKDYPINQLLQLIARTWTCEWRFLPGSSTVVLLRAKYWWMEDEVDVPEEFLERYGPSLQGPEAPPIASLVAVAGLRLGQVQKLLGSGLYPGILGMTAHGWYDDGQVVACLRMFQTLPDAQRTRMLSPDGLPLAEVNPAVLSGTMLTFLQSAVGALEPADWSKLTLSMQGRETSTFKGVLLRIRADGEETGSWAIGLKS